MGGGGKLEDNCDLAKVRLIKIGASLTGVSIDVPVLNGRKHQPKRPS